MKITKELQGRSTEKESQLRTNCRMAFRIKCELVEGIRRNDTSRYNMREEDAPLCPHCPCVQIQTQRHFLVCPQWTNIRSRLNKEKKIADGENEG